MVSHERLRQYHGLSQEYWERLDERGRESYAIVRPTPANYYQVDVAATRLQDWVDSNQRDLGSLGGNVSMCPDFQRGHVWTSAQRTAYCESFMRGQAPALLIFNCPSFHGATDTGLGDLPRHELQCIDGLQRFTALTEFAAGRVLVFGGRSVADFSQTPFDLQRFRAQVRVYSFQSRAELLSFYLDLNSGGTVHSQEELTRVRGLLESATVTDAPQARGAAPSRKRRRP